MTSHGAHDGLDAVLERIQEISRQQSPQAQLVHQISFLQQPPITAEPTDHQVPSTVFPQPDPAEVPGLLQLPLDVFCLIADQLTPESLFFLHQTSRELSRLCRGEASRRLYRPDDKPPVRVEHEAHHFWQRVLTSGISDASRKKLRLTLKERGHCRSCWEMYAGNGFSCSLLYLFCKESWCGGCGFAHPWFYFSEDEISKRDWERQCIGRRGRISLCDHANSPSPVTWDALEAHANGSRKIGGTRDASPGGGAGDPGPPGPDHICTDRAHHQAIVPEGHERVVSALPRITLRPAKTKRTTRLKAGHSICIAWDVPLLQVGEDQHRDQEALRRQLSRAVTGSDDQPSALHGQRLCPHVTPRHLAAMVSDMACPCLVRNPVKPAQLQGNNPATAEPCTCTEEQGSFSSACRHCAAEYRLCNIEGYIYLVFRSSWTVHQPTSPSWLALLDGVSVPRDPSRRSIFWCRRPGCTMPNRQDWTRAAKLHTYNWMTMPLVMEMMGPRGRFARRLMDDHQELVRASARHGLEYEEIQTRSTVIIGGFTPFLGA